MPLRATTEPQEYTTASVVVQDAQNHDALRAALLGII